MAETSAAGGFHMRLQPLGSVCVRWLVFLVLVAISIVLPSGLPWLNDVAGPLPGLWLLWIVKATATGGFTAIGDFNGTVYLQRSSELLALIFWALSGLGYGLLTRRIPLRYATLAAYPAMLTLLFLTMGIVRLCGYEQHWYI
jgi:hypothetical protein